MGALRRFPSGHVTLPPGGGPLFVLFLAQHSACVRAMDALKQRRIRPRDFHDEYLRQLERFWSLDEEELRLFGVRRDDPDNELWDDFCTARQLYRVTNGAVLLDRDTRA